MKPRGVDHLKMKALLAVRTVNRLAIEQWSPTIYRRIAKRARTANLALSAVPAREHYRSDDIPSGLYVPRSIPKELRLGRSYVLAYYLLAGTAFKLYRRMPMPEDVTWDPSVSLHLRNDEGWDNICADEEFAQLRLQGPNPYVLARGEAANTFRADYGAAFAGVHVPTSCQFRMEHEKLVPSAIEIGSARFAPGDHNWQRAKLIANALDARHTVFVQHLLRTHLIVGQVYALSAAALPQSHPIGAFLDLHTYGTLHVNDFAWRLLLTPASYFIQANFITRANAITMFHNCLQTFSFDTLVPELDAKARGIDSIPNHPYVNDAVAAWRTITNYVRDVVGCYTSDAQVREDRALCAWHEQLVALFPNPTALLKTMNTREELITLLAVLVFNNVVHEVSGDFSVFVTSEDPANKRLVNMARMHDDSEVRLNDAFLFEQGAFSGMFNSTGNNMLHIPVEPFVHDERLRRCVQTFREHLLVLDQEVAARNEARPYKFQRIRPKQWEFSISF
jgi:hypothetical protein